MLAAPERYAGETVGVEGQVRGVCERLGLDRLPADLRLLSLEWSAPIA